MPGVISRTPEKYWGRYARISEFCKSGYVLDEQKTEMNRHVTEIFRQALDNIEWLALQQGWMWIISLLW